LTCQHTDREEQYANEATCERDFGSAEKLVFMWKYCQNTCNKILIQIGLFDEENAFVVKLQLYKRN